MELIGIGSPVDDKCGKTATDDVVTSFWFEKKKKHVSVVVNVEETSALGEHCDRKETKEETWHIGSILAKGGQGRVYLAHQIQRQQHQRGKEIPVGVATILKCGHGLRNEYRLLEKLEHLGVQAIPRVYRFGRCWSFATNCTTAVREDVFLMQRVSGITLAHGLRLWRTFREERAREIIASLLTTLSQCHAHGIVHRDIKPENIILPHSRSVSISVWLHSAHSV